MAVELKEVLEAMDFSKDDFTLEDVTNHIKETFVARKMVGEDPEIVSAITGKAMGSITTAIKRATKEAGLDIDFNAEDFKGKKIEEVISNVFAKNVATEFNTLKEKAKTGNSKKDEDWQKQIDGLNAKVQEYETIKTNLSSELDDVKKSKDDTIKSFKINSIYGDVKSKIAFSEQAGNLALRGFEEIIKEKYAFGFDEEKNEIIVNDAKSGTRIKNDKGTDFLSLTDVLTAEANAAGILKKNNAAAQARQPFTANAGDAGNGGAATKPTFIHPNALKTMEQLKTS